MLLVKLTVQTKISDGEFSQEDILDPSKNQESMRERCISKDKEEIRVAHSEDFVTRHFASRPFAHPTLLKEHTSLFCCFLYVFACEHLLGAKRFT